jgi:hypothetical protein
MDRTSPPSLQSATRLLNRRTFLTAGASAGAAALAGCSAIADFIAGFVLQDANVFNGTDQAVTGTIEVVDPNDETVLDEPFDLQAGTDNTDSGNGGDSNQQSAAVYDDVLTDNGDYDVSITLDEGSAIEGQAEAAETVEVTDTGNEHLFVFLGASESNEAITIGAVEGLSDIEELDNS